jgi:ABC-2 type transport system permease protein
MSVTVGDVVSVAKRDFLDVRRAKLVWAPVALYTLFMLLFLWGQSNDPEPSFYGVLWSLVGTGGVLLVPLIALVAAYLSVAGERESGSIKFTLGQPIHRGAVVLGKVGSRTGVVGVGLLVSFVVGALAAPVLVPEMTVEYDAYAQFIGVTLLYALAYVSVAVGVSAATGSRSRAMGGAIGFYFLFNLVWNVLPVGPVQMMEFVLDQLGRDPENYSNLLELVFSLSPTGAYLNGTTKLVMTDEFAAQVNSNVQDQPWFLEGWFMLVILGAWVVLPLAVGYWRFDGAELG